MTQPIEVSALSSMGARALNRYYMFGLKEVWVDMFFSDPENYFKDNNHRLALNQVSAVTNWLKDAEIINEAKGLTELGEILHTEYIHNPELVWEIIWINLVRNSIICRWFALNVKPGMTYSKRILTDMFVDELQPEYSLRTVDCAISAMLSTFKSSPIGERFGLFVNPEKLYATRTYTTQLSVESFAYSIYCYAESLNTKLLSISDLYCDEAQSCVKVEFGLPIECAKKMLANLSSANNTVLVTELNMGQESISLRKELTAISALKKLLK